MLLLTYDGFQSRSGSGVQPFCPCASGPAATSELAASAHTLLASSFRLAVFPGPLFEQCVRMFSTYSPLSNSSAHFGSLARWSSYACLR